MEEVRKCWILQIKFIPWTKPHRDDKGCVKNYLRFKLEETI